MCFLWMVNLVLICKRFKISQEEAIAIPQSYKSPNKPMSNIERHKPPSPTEYDSGSEDSGRQKNDASPHQIPIKSTYGACASILQRYPKSKDSSMESSVVARSRRQLGKERKRHVRVRKLKTFPGKLGRLVSLFFAV